MTPEQTSRTQIDALLGQAGWAVQDAGSVNLYERRGVAVREFGLKPGHGTADYLLYVDQKATGVVEAKPAGYTLTGVETQSGNTATAFPKSCPRTASRCPSCTRRPERKHGSPTCWTLNRAVVKFSPSTRPSRWQNGLDLNQEPDNPPESA